PIECSFHLPFPCAIADDVTGALESGDADARGVPDPLDLPGVLEETQLVEDAAWLDDGVNAAAVSRAASPALGHESRDRRHAVDVWRIESRVQDVSALEHVRQALGQLTLRKRSVDDSMLASAL